jgi:hypothetical protein
MSKKLAHCPGVNNADAWFVAKDQNAGKLARRYNVQTELMRDWLTGNQPMPRMLYELLALGELCELPSTAGLFAGWRVEKGERLSGPGIEHKGGLHWLDIARLPEYRRLDHLTSKQADLIERLTRERDFYKRQCELETRAGLMLRKIIDGGAKPQR